MAADLIRQSLERLAERRGDPTPQVYARLFAARPEAEALFVGDRTGAVRGEMLAQAFEALLDLADGGDQGARLIAIERVNHEGLGVPPEVFADFFPVLADVVREGLGEGWTAEVAAAWGELTERAVTLAQG
ncbi:MAG: globin [Caulobacter sp.]|nr:globin [Caulobacter sp.]